ncbi:MerR family transcriptional regulator [Flammeovirgaceae bacterium SG7u.111]|nr:MerR family transcriptional regulator [Flammeovirgaceae bacterium SG7u.132]WPO33011.1 MerR family transcriptional regulator [Flammeovirgaceae bacterium SG7u.111]
MEIEKRYYTIGEVAEQFEVATSLIRFWESQFDIIKPKKNKNGARQYTKNDIEAIRTIYHLVKEKGFTLQGAKETLKKNPKIKANAEAVRSLKKVREFLIDLRSNIKDEQE